MGGSGERLGAPGGIVKQLRPLAGAPVAAWAASALALHPGIDSVVCAVPGGEAALFGELLLPLSPKISVCAGGSSRSGSVSNALAALDASCRTVLVHDGVRPFVSADLVGRVIRAAETLGPAVAAVRVSDTLKAGSEPDPGAAPAAWPPARRIVSTVPRRGLWRAQTPQGFPREVLEEALASAADHPDATDEASLAEMLGYRVWLVEGDEMNMKITSPGDLEMAELLAPALRGRLPAAAFGLRGGAGPGPADLPGEGGGPGDRGAPPAWASLKPGDLRVGQGVDFHAFADDGRPLRLGLVCFPGETGLLGHSDADVLAHALADAILGAAGLGDIGGIFPDTDPRWRGASGSELLGGVWKLAGRRFRLVNADLTLIGERPRIASRRGEMARAVAGVLGADPAAVNVKGKTTEGMGFLGRGEGLGAQAAVLLEAVSAAGGRIP
jgi:2-C-methyl-D-erythritol 4-phosphate cytidylyltransferase/2-C-methyl-D-erythritol 2,4-cyclodiphosphate synthase